MQLGGKTEVCLRPLVVMARPAPPGRLHSSTGFPYEGQNDRSRGSSPASACQIALGPFQSRIGRQFPSGDLSPSSLAVQFGLAASGHRMSLSMLLSTRDHRHNAAATLVCCNPWSSGRPAPLKDRNPSGEPEARRSRSVTGEDLSLAWVKWCFPRISPVPAPFHSASRLPTPCLGRTSRLFSTYAGISRRQAQVCLRPLVCFGQTRASRPPPLQHRVPTRTAL